ncbi:hypothetical protein EJB05_51713, partial [Eragrostis curvula]
LAHLIDSSSDKYVIAGLLSSASSGGEGAAAIQRSMPGRSCQWRRPRVRGWELLPMAAASSSRRRAILASDLAPSNQSFLQDI